MEDIYQVYFFDEDQVGLSEIEGQARPKCIELVGSFDENYIGDTGRKFV